MTSVSCLLDQAVDRPDPQPRAPREGLGITSMMLGDVDELAPIVARLAGT